MTLTVLSLASDFSMQSRDRQLCRILCFRGEMAGNSVRRNRLLQWYLSSYAVLRGFALFYGELLWNLVREDYFLVNFSGHTAEYNRKSYSCHTFL